MLELNFDIWRKDNRPVITTQQGSDWYKHLIDTGAQVPLFCHGMINFDRFAKWHGNYSIEGTAKVSGLGLYPVTAQKCTLDQFTLTDKVGNKLVYKKLKFVVLADTDYPFDTLLPANLFGKFRNTFDYTLWTPELTIEAPKDTYYVGFHEQNGPSYVFLTD